MIPTRADKKLLLQLSRNVIINCLTNDTDEFKELPLPTDSLQINCGAFVSLYVKGKLRGCIGTFSEEEILYKTIQKMSVSAATSDSRFSPVELHELKDLMIEISVLSPRERIYDKGDITLGKHGIYMERGVNRGTLLPQVAMSQNWTVDEFLGNCAKYKAGIGWNDWKSAHLYIYEAYVFNTNEFQIEC